MAKGNFRKEKGAVIEAAPKQAEKQSDTVGLFNSSSAPVGIMTDNGRVITLAPFSVISTPVDREFFQRWSKTKVGQGYLDKGIICTNKSDKIGFDKTSDISAPAQLIDMPGIGSVSAEMVQKPTLDGGMVLPKG